MRVQTIGQSYDQQDFEEIVVLARSDGTAVRLGDIADVRDAFQNTDLILEHEGRPAVYVEVFRADGEQVMDVATAVHEHTANVITPSLPDGVGITIWNDESQSYAERVDLLVRNGLLGILLVFIALALFLELRLAMWVVVGMVTSGIGALAVMLVLDIAINTISLFAFVLAIGIMVDDAIVVAEHIYLERQRGTSGVVAAIRGARRIRNPLTFAVLTSVAAFAPLLFIPGNIGEIWTALPVIIIGMLFISLAESLFILPSHLSHMHGPDWKPTSLVDRFFAGTRNLVGSNAERIPGRPPGSSAARLHESSRRRRVQRHRPARRQPVPVPAGIVPTTFADVVEGDFVTATLEMPDGTPAERTYAVAMELEQAGRRVLERLDQERPRSAPSLLSGVTVTVGQRPRVEGAGSTRRPPRIRKRTSPPSISSSWAPSSGTCPPSPSCRSGARRSASSLRAGRSPSAARSSISAIPSMRCCRIQIRSGWGKSRIRSSTACAPSRGCSTSGPTTRPVSARFNWSCGRRRARWPDGRGHGAAGAGGVLRRGGAAAAAGA